MRSTVSSGLRATAAASILAMIACGEVRAGADRAVPATAGVQRPTSTSTSTSTTAHREPAELVRATIVSRVGDGAIDDRPKHARKGEAVTLFALVEIRRGAQRMWVGDVAPTTDVVIAGHHVAPHPWTDGPAVHISWNRIEPAQATMSNTERGTFAFEAIDYRATEVAAAADRTSIAADVRPTLTPDHGDGVGTMRFQIAITDGEHTIASPGADARRGRGSGGLVDGVHRISIRRDDTYLGYLTELYGQPYIWASAGTSDATHQSERLEGSDCADFVVYGARRLGLRVPYTWTAELPRFTRTLSRGAPDDGGVYRDAHGAAIPFPAVGDLVLFPRHVGVLVEDRGQLGVLDDHDVIMHALFDTPKEVAIADSGYDGLPIEVLRWPAPPRASRAR